MDTPGAPPSHAPEDQFFGWNNLHSRSHLLRSLSSPALDVLLCVMDGGECGGPSPELRAVLRESRAIDAMVRRDDGGTLALLWPLDRLRPRGEPEPATARYVAHQTRLANGQRGDHPKGILKRTADADKRAVGAEDDSWMGVVEEACNRNNGECCGMMKDFAVGAFFTVVSNSPSAAVAASARDPFHKLVAHLIETTTLATLRRRDVLQVGSTFGGAVSSEDDIEREVFADAHGSKAEDEVEEPGDCRFAHCGALATAADPVANVTVLQPSQSPRLIPDDRFPAHGPSRASNDPSPADLVLPSPAESASTEPRPGSIAPSENDAVEEAAGAMTAAAMAFTGAYEYASPGEEVCERIIVTPMLLTHGEAGDDSKRRVLAAVKPVSRRKPLLDISRVRGNRQAPSHQPPQKKHRQHHQDDHHRQQPKVSLLKLPPPRIFQQSGALEQQPEGRVTARKEQSKASRADSATASEPSLKPTPARHDGDTRPRHEVSNALSAGADGRGKKRPKRPKTPKTPTVPARCVTFAQNCDYGGSRGGGRGGAAAPHSGQPRGDNQGSDPGINRRRAREVKRGPWWMVPQKGPLNGA